MSEKKRDGPRTGRSTNILLANGVSLTLNNNPYNSYGVPANGLGWIHQLIIGATGRGKTRYFLQPNVMALPTDPITGRAVSMVITDPKGDLVIKMGQFLEAHGYVVKVFNMFETDKSDCYNPFAYVRSQRDLAVLVDGVVANMGEGKNKGDHWEASAKNVLQSICSYIYYEMPYAEANMGTMTALLNMWESSEEDNFKSMYDYLIEELRAEKGNDHPAVNWRDKVAAKGAELSSIISTAQTITSVFNEPEIRTIMDTDSLELDMIGRRPTALFIITPPSTKAYDFIPTLMYNQLFNLQSDIANRDYKDQGGTLPHKIWYILDEFGNLSKIPGLDQQITIVRQSGQFFSLIVQAPSQIKAVYGDEVTDNILSNIETTIFLGSSGDSLNDKSASDYMSKALGNKTIQSESTSVSYDGRNGKPRISHSYAPTQRPLMTADEVKALPFDECLIKFGGGKPIRAKKIMNLDQCLNYEVFQKIGDYDIAKEKSTERTYMEGRLKSEEIEAIQDRCRAREEARKRKFRDINEEYQKSLSDAEMRREEETFSSYFDAADLLLGGKAPMDELMESVHPVGGFHAPMEEPEGMGIEDPDDVDDSTEEEDIDISYVQEDLQEDLFGEGPDEYEGL